MNHREALATLLREELAANPHENDEGHMRCTCDECIAAVAVLGVRADHERPTVTGGIGNVTDRALDTDTMAREATLGVLIGLLLLRHAAWLNTDDSNPHRPIYALAQQSAEREIAFRFASR